MMIGGIVLFFFAIITFSIVVMWKFFKKAGFKGYESLIPIHNLVVLIQIAGKPISYFFLLLIPIVNIIYMVKIINGISRAFGKGVGFTLGLIFLPIIFLPILVWGKSEYNSTQEISRVEISFSRPEPELPVVETEKIPEEVTEEPHKQEVVAEGESTINQPVIIEKIIPEGAIPEMKIISDSPTEIVPEGSIQNIDITDSEENLAESPTDKPVL